MELANIELLIEKYFEGETSLNEEQLLKQYFTNNKVPSHLEAYQDLFGYFVAKQNEVLEQTIQVVKPKKLPIKWLSIAAMVAVVLGAYIFTPHTNKPSQAELKQDYQNTQLALQLISKNLNKGAFAMAQLQEFDVAKDKIFKEK